MDHPARLLALMIGGVFGLLSAANADVVHNAATDFSQAQNPNSVWSYGQSALLNSPFTLYTNTVREFPQVESWNAGSGSFLNPSVSHNPAMSAVTVATITFPPGQLGVHPGEFGEYSVVRFVAPAAGAYSLTSSFTGIDFHGPTSTDVHVLLNNSALFSGLVNSFGGGPSFATELILAAGDTIDFKVGVGGNGNYFFDTTGLAAQITRREAVPEPSSFVIFGICALATLLMTRPLVVNHFLGFRFMAQLAHSKS